MHIMQEENISGVLYTKYDEVNFSCADVYPNEEGNVCIKIDKDSWIVLTPMLAKRLKGCLSQSINSSLGMILGEE